jgi:hypothetical protein
MLKWDGSDLGDITSYVEIHHIEESGVYIRLKNDKTIIRVYKFDNSIPLIADELKYLFGIIKIGRHKALYNNNDVLLCKIEGIEQQFEIKNDMYAIDIQRSLIFRWALGLTAKGEYPLFMRTYKSGLISITSFLDKTITYDESKLIGSKLSTSMIDKWFYDPYDVNKLINIQFKKEDLLKIRWEIESIIKRIDNNYCWWTMAIIGRIQSKID